ncbi:anhydro-N-acetylmuramic acid kinase [Arenicella chitinivorans]|uniref:Anhydro-N-acetylmuramic acid kinase n=1 Tax=Arenicella chitinivorans TaxID=1329800 RepID=A0A918RSD4_9GAMM|nr:anhydro-N-acetylmuramic acid kinase [Arenicella chitinivorans]GHA07453.1 anhydro-N-acetylmuramic acid kinase [Arenicella chitinivorans]
MRHLIVGMMSGTSMDGIDAALVEFTSTSQLRVLQSSYTAYPPALRNELNYLALHNEQIFVPSDSHLHAELAEHYAAAATSLIDTSGIKQQDISAIANHGQTVRHEPNRSPAFSIQLGDGKHIAMLTGIPTICQFRQADLAAGGQGAPLMPAFHRHVFGMTESHYVLNLGGIGNVTRLSDPVLGFDTGPANCLMDQWTELHTAQRYDLDGAWAKTGRVNQALLSALLSDPYFTAPYPKSTGTDYFNLNWVRARYPKIDLVDPADVQATLLELTVDSVSRSLQQLHAQSGKIFVCGGGANNAQLMARLQSALTAYEVTTTDALNVPADWVEAVGFAWLGYCFLTNTNSNMPSVTGARKQVVLGQQYTPD